jgi:hypothetical protein
LVIGLGVLVVPLLLLWVFENNAMTNVMVAYRTAVDAWMLAQGVPIQVAAGTFADLEFDAFTISMMPLGYSILLAWLAWRLGRRISSAPQLWPLWAGAAGTYWLVSFGLLRSVEFAGAMPDQILGAIMPTVFFSLFMVLGSVLGEPKAVYGVAKSAQAYERTLIRDWFAARFETLPWVIRVVWSPALRAGSAIAIALVAVSSLLIGLLVLFNWINVITFYETIHVGIFGGLGLTIAQVTLMPNFAIWGASWLTGTGFAIGSGSLISPLGSAAGPLPLVPILSILPQGTLSFGMVALVVPLVLTFLATVWVRDHARDVRYEFATPLASALSLGMAIAAVTAVELTLLGWLASGGFGPARFAIAGVNPLMLFAVTFVEVAAVSVLTSFYSARPDRD